MKRKFCIIISIILLASIVGNAGVNLPCHAEENISLYEAENIVNQLNEIVQENRESMMEDVAAEIITSDNWEDYIGEETQQKIEKELDRLDNTGSVDKKIDSLIDTIEQENVDREVVEDIQENLEIKKAEDLAEQDLINPYTDKKINTVESVKEYLISCNYEIDEELVELCEVIEEIKNNEDSFAKTLVEVDSKIKDEYSKNYFGFGKKAKAASFYKETYAQWTALTKAEKALIVLNPKNALISKSAAKKAYEMTKDVFGRNGLGDKSDGFRHGVWNALITRDSTRAWAEAYTTAHESGKTKKELDKLASDNYSERSHRNMDLHNNSVGRSVIRWYDSRINVSNNEVKKRIKKKLTNKKSTGIYWLHN